MEVTGDPVHNHACTCTRCQQDSGSVLAHNVWFPEANVQVSGEYKIWYPHGPSTPDVMKSFCHTCGGGGFAKSGTYLPATIVIAAGTFGDPTFPQPDHVHWWLSRPGWIMLAEEIERLPGN